MIHINEYLNQLIYNLRNYLNKEYTINVTILERIARSVIILRLNYRNFARSDDYIEQSGKVNSYIKQLDYLLAHNYNQFLYDLDHNDVGGAIFLGKDAAIVIVADNEKFTEENAKQHCELILLNLQNKSEFIEKYWNKLL